MYGCNKLYCEQLGRYYALHYKQLAANTAARRVDFRSVRFPGLISATTMPAGGTSDYASEMIHAAARGERYACFVRPDTRIPFMAMPDAVDALLALAHAPRDASDEDRLQSRRRSARPPRKSATIVLQRVSGRDHRLRRRREAPVHRRFVADRRRRFGGARRLALSDPSATISRHAFSDYLHSDRPAALRFVSRPRIHACGYIAMTDRVVTAFAPATVSNVACGFDVLGFPMEEPGDCVTARLTASGGVTIDEIIGDEGRLPREASATRRASPRARCSRRPATGAAWR